MLSKLLLKELQTYVNKNINSKEKESTAITEDNNKPAFNQLLLTYIDERRVCDSEIYRKAGIDSKQFSKIRSNAEYIPAKNTAIALAMALELEQIDTNKLLHTAGYVLSCNDVFDLAILFCIEKKIYSIDDVNLALDYLGLKPLTGETE